MKSMNSRRRRQISLRQQRGVIGSVLLLIGILITLLFASIAVDIAHFVSASSEMQSVADAAALMGCYDLQWNSTAANMSQATIDANYMVQKSSTDIYNAGTNSIPLSNVQISYSSLNGGTNNAITVTISPPIAFLFAPMIGNTSQVVNVAATAQRLPVASAPSPPWFLETTTQIGPDSPPPLPSPAPAPPTTFPSNGYVTFADSSQPGAGLAPPILPTYWIDMGLSNLSTAQTNPVGVQKVIQCMGRCVNGSSCDTSNPVVIGGSVINANHGSYNSNISNPRGNSDVWSSGATTVLPITTNGNVVGIYIVKLTGPYQPNSYRNGQGVYGEFGIQFTGSADGIDGVTVADPTQGAVYNNVSATVATLVK